MLAQHPASTTTLLCLAFRLEFGLFDLLAFCLQYICDRSARASVLVIVAIGWGGAILGLGCKTHWEGKQEKVRAVQANRARKRTKGERGLDDETEVIPRLPAKLSVAFGRAERSRLTSLTGLNPYRTSGLHWDSGRECVKMATVQKNRPD